MKFKPMTRRFRIPGDTSNNPKSVIVLRQNEDGGLSVRFYDGSIDLVLKYDNDSDIIAALGFPTQPPTDEPDPEIETLVEVPE